MKHLITISAPSGSGKTTLLNVIGGQLKPNKGLVQKDNLDLTNLSPRLKVKHGLARSFQVVRTFDTLTSFENIKAASLISEIIFLLISSKFSFYLVINFCF